MASLIPGYNYDIFISYSQKDNKYDGWVTEFVENLKKELEATFKESINLYFDINPHDGLLESHEVEDSLEDKLKSLIFIPILSRTYCDPNSFAWQHEFVRFVEIANTDSYGLKIKLPAGNVGSRVLPIRINDIDKEDINLCETVLGGKLRGIEFIYAAPGVNRPLRANEDHANENLNKTYYRDQINKVAHSIHDLILGISGKKEFDSTQIQEFKSAEHDSRPLNTRNFNLPNRKIILSALVSAILIFLALIYLLGTRINSTEIFQKAILAVDPYGNWPTYKGVIRLRNIRINAELEYNEIIEIDRGSDIYRRTFLLPDQKEISGFQNGRYYHEVWNAKNNKVKVTMQDSIDKEYIDTFKEHHTCLFGLLMELKNSGLQLRKKARKVNFHDAKCYSIDFTYDSTLKVDNYFKRNWTVFLNRKDFSLKGYQTSSQEGDTFGVKYYTIFSGRFNLNYITIPLCITYYLNPDDSFLFLDIITRPENSN
jgi:hypothetical protein